MNKKDILKDLILAIVPIVISNIAEGVREYLSDRRVAQKEWEQKIENAKAGKYD